MSANSFVGVDVCCSPRLIGSQLSFIKALLISQKLSFLVTYSPPAQQGTEWLYMTAVGGIPETTQGGITVTICALVELLKAWRGGWGSVGFKDNINMFLFLVKLYMWGFVVNYRMVMIPDVWSFLHDSYLSVNIRATLPHTSSSSLYQASHQDFPSDCQDGKSLMKISVMLLLDVPSPNIHLQHLLRAVMISVLH